MLSVSAVLGASALSACSGTVEPGVGENAAGTATAVRSKVVARTLVKGATTKVSLQTLPHSLCELTGDRPGGSLRVFSDDRGVASFYANFEAVKPFTMTLTCSDDSGTRDVQSIETRLDVADSDAVLQEALDRQALEGLPHPGAKVLPGLSANEATQLAEEDLQALGYPPRGTTDVNSKEYQRWLQLVAKPVTVLAPSGIDNAGVQSGPETLGTYGNWSGLQLDAPGGATAPAYKFGYVYGEFHIPAVVASSPQTPANQIETRSAFWVGLYDIGLVQDGTEQNVYWGLIDPDVGYGFVTSYQAWTEYLQLENQNIVSNLQVSANDEMAVWAWVSDAKGHNGSGAPSNTCTVSADCSPAILIGNDGYAWFYIWDLTTGHSSGYIPFNYAKTTAKFTGSSALWIMERPTVNGSYTLLANYGTAKMQNLSAKQFNNTPQSYSTAPYGLSSMVYNGDTLSTATLDSSGNVDFTWVASE